MPNVGFTGIQEILRQYWGYDAFRPFQRDIILSILAGQDTLAILPTGGGKSVCFQVPALALEGTCLVISPLIALMNDQVEHLKRKNIPAAALTSNLNYRESELVLENFVNKHYKLLYVSPERLKSKNFFAYLQHAVISFIAIDEAHCISQWGYDFRPSYLEIAQVRDAFPKLPVLALTASATPFVQKDIQDKLRFSNRNIFQGTFLRSNLSYSAFELENKGQKLIEILKKVPGSAVVYVQSRKSAFIWSSWLNQNGLRAEYYHAGLSHNERVRRQKAWIEGTVPILVATNAFGMGIDKPDVRTVIHVEVPTQPEAYYQEAGRAGRDGKKAYAVALFSKKELKDSLARLEANFPVPEFIRDVYNKLAMYLKIAIGSGEMAVFDFSFEQFCKTFNLPIAQTYQALRKLEIAGFIQFAESVFQPSRLHFIVSQATLYDAQIRSEEVEKVSKALLRLYGGELFSDFVDIREQDLATVLKVSTVLVDQWLALLESRGLAQYDKRSELPRITFLTPRLESKNLNLDLNLLESLKKRELERCQMMHQYLLLERQCRSAFLASYFGEADPSDCGICDNCLAKRKHDAPLSYSYFKPIILKELSVPQDLNEYINQFRPSQREEVRKTISFLLEEEMLRFDKEGKLSIRRR